MNIGKVKKWIVCAAVTLILTLLLMFMLPKIVDKISVFNNESVICNKNEKVTECINDTTVLDQTFEMPYDYLYGVKLFCSTNQVYNKGNLIVRITDEKKTIKTWKQDMRMLSDTAYLELETSKIKVQKGEKYHLLIQSDSKDSKVVVYTSGQDVYKTGALYVNGEQLNTDISMTILGRNYTNDNVWLFGMLLLLSMFIIVYMVFSLLGNPRTQYLQTITFTDVIFAIVLLFLFTLAFSQGGDLGITIKHSEDLLSIIKQGKIKDFYSIVLSKAVDGGYYNSSTFGFGANYNIGLYIILAIIISPCVLLRKLFNVVYNDLFILNYVECFLALLDIFSAYLVYKVSINIGFKKEYSKIIAYLYITSTMFLFATVGFGQLDIIAIIFMLIGLNYYVKNQYTKFSLFFAIAVALKMFALFVFIPLILLIEKRLVHIFKYMLYCICIVFANMIVYGGNSGYLITNSKMGEIYDFTGRFFSVSLDNAIHGSLSIFLLVFVLVCISAYNSNNKEKWKGIIQYPLIIFTAFIVLVGWHPQWLAISCPFIVLALAVSGSNKTVFYCEMLFNIFYIFVSNLSFPKNADNYMMNNGIFKIMTGHTYVGATISQVVGSIKHANEMIYSVMTALIIGFTWISLKEVNNYRMNSEKMPVLSRWFVWGRVAIGLLYVLFLSVFYFYVG